MSFNHLLPRTPSDAPLLYPPQLNVNPNQYVSPCVIPTDFAVQTTYTTFWTDFGFGVSPQATPQVTTTCYTESVQYVPAAYTINPCFTFYQPPNGSTAPDAPSDRHQLGNERRLRAQERRKNVRFNPIVDRQPSPASIGRLDKRKRRNEDVCKWLDNHLNEIHGTEFRLSDVETSESSMESIEL